MKTFKESFKFPTMEEAKDSISFLVKNENEMDQFTTEQIYKNVPIIRELHNYYARKIYVTSYSWSIPCKEAFDLIEKTVPKNNIIYDLLAGTGYWAKLLSKRGFSVSAFDIHNSPKYNYYQHKPQHHPIKRGNAMKIANRLSHVNKPVNIMLSWIPCGSNIGYHVLNAIPIDSIVILIGEGKTGCTGTEKTFDLLENQYQSLGYSRLPQWMGIHDNIEVFKRFK